MISNDKTSIMSLANPAVKGAQSRSQGSLSRGGLVTVTLFVHFIHLAVKGTLPSEDPVTVARHKMTILVVLG